MLSPASLFLMMMALSVVMLLVLSSLTGSGTRGIREWLAANALAVVALPLFAGRGYVPELVSIELANLLLMNTSVMMLAGLRRHLGQPVPWRILAVSVGFGIVVIVAFHLVIDDIGLRIVGVSLVHAGLCIAMAASVARALRSAPRRYPYLFTLATSSLVALGMLVRAGIYAAEAAGWMAPVDESTMTLVFYPIGTLSLPALTLGAVMMANAEIIARATYAADHDHLTGAPSRRAFFTLAERERARASAKGLPMSLLLFDVDHFKRINDTHGHGIGDRVLVEIATRAGAVLRSRDAYGRLGGEEFGVLLPDSTAPIALRVAERMRAALQVEPGHERLDGRDSIKDTTGIGYTVSIGVATLLPGETVASLLSRADLALYAAKAAGRNRVVAADPVLSRLPRRQG